MRTAVARGVARWFLLWLLCLSGVARSEPAPTAATDDLLPRRTAGAAFTPGGAYGTLSWNLGGHPAPPLWGSWSGSDALTGTLTLGPFRAPPRFLLAVAGYPTAAGNALFLRRVSDGAVQPLAAYDPHELWSELPVAPPPAWVGQSVEICAVDNATGPGGWLALSEPYARDAWGRLRPLGGGGDTAAGWPLARWHRDGAPLAAFFLNAVLLLLPGAALLPALRRRVPLADSLALLTMFALSALCGYA
ncbi:MAG: hypothetical protein JO117_00700, partial [Verrucomicrobia bacterium]|nr:hypothetical protein [Verrucomicrobiota bacterium]